MDPLKLTIKELTNGHYLPEKRKRKQRNTVYGYESSLNRHVIPKWGGMRIEEISQDAVQDWVDELSQTKAGIGGAEKAYKCLRQVIRWTISKWGLYVADPTRGIEMPRKPVKKLEVLTQRRVKRLVRGCVGFKYEVTVVIQVALGTRPGENYFLHWEDINWRTGEVRIRGTLQQVAGLVYEAPTKTAKSERDLFLQPWALDRVHEIWVALGRPKGRIIGDAKPMAVSRALKMHIKKNKLPKITMKNLRHTWATLALKSGSKIEHVAEMLGHTNIQTCYRYYMTMTAATKKRVQRKLSQLVLGKCDDMYKGLDRVLPAPIVSEGQITAAA